MMNNEDRIRELEANPPQEYREPEEDLYREVPEEEQGPPPQRQVLCIPSQAVVNSEVLGTAGGEYAEVMVGNIAFGGTVYLDRATCLQVGADLLQMAGRMTPPKVVKAQAKAAADLAIVERDKTLIDPAGRPLTTQDMRV
jgi:hypothetical protein